MILDTRPAILQRVTGLDPESRGRCLTLPDGAQPVKPVAGGVDKGSVVISVVREPLIPSTAARPAGPAVFVVTSDDVPQAARAGLYRRP